MEKKRKYYINICYENKIFIVGGKGLKKIYVFSKLFYFFLKVKWFFNNFFLKILV